MTVFDELSRRGLIAQTTNEEKIKEILSNENVTFYIGFDATASSLHIGHFLQMIVIRHMQQAGHKAIVLLGTGTTLVGDPTGKTDMRKMLTPEQVDHNAECFKRQMSKFIDFSPDKAQLVKNGDWLGKMKYIDFLRDVGRHFSVNKMLTAECFKSRLEKGLSFLEFNYMLMQSYDFLHLYRNYGCKMELGGDDQWANILSGVDLVRRECGEEAYAMTFTLLTTTDGKKMGKTEKGALWLDAEKTGPYDFFQHWRNVSDDEVIRLMKMLTFIPVEEIEELEKSPKLDINAAKDRLAYEITALVHGKENAENARATAKSLFKGDFNDINMPSTILSKDDFSKDQIGLLSVLVKAGLAPSNAEARRLVSGGGVSVDEATVSDPSMQLNYEKIAKGIIIKKGKKVFHKILAE